MADAPKTSFIPKQTMGKVPKRATVRRSFNVFNFVATIVFLGALLLSVGVYFYEDYNQAELVSQKQRLAEIKNTFSQSDIESLQELDRRIDTARQLLLAHLSPSQVLDTLERRTQGDLEFTSFKYLMSDSGRVVVELGGQALRFNTVALQAQQFAVESVFDEVIFSDLNIAAGAEGEPDKVEFVVSALVDTDVIGYAAPVDAEFNTDDNTPAVDESFESNEGVIPLDEVTTEGADDTLDGQFSDEVDSFNEGI